MRLCRFAVLYTAIVFGANLAVADTATFEALRDGDMRKLSFHAESKAVPEVTLLDADDTAHTLAEYHGRYVVLNFWATWCAPCRYEMPSLDRLEAEFGGDDFAVVPVATGRNSVAGIHRFFDEAKIAHLPILRDTRQELAREMGVLGLPVTVILNPEGHEIARLIGDAEWDSESAKAIVAALLADG